MQRKTLSVASAALVVLALALIFAGGALAAAPAAQGPLPLDQVDTLVMPAVDNEALLKEDLQTWHPGVPVRFALPIPVDIQPSERGTWETLAGGDLMWRLRIQSPGAISLNLGFTRYVMPPGGQLRIATADGQHAIRPFTDADNEIHGQLWTPILPGDDILIEVTLPAAAANLLELTLGSVNHGYTEFGRAPVSGACNLDVICGAANGFPQVDAWRSQIRSVAVISTGGSTFCTGFMVNNTAQDLKPYFMTANHCGINSGNAASLVTYWNYENSTCRLPGSPASGGPGDGQLNQFLTGSFFRSSFSSSDFTLVELDDPAPSAFNIYWAGWNATTADPTSAVAIHHPNTDEKRISFENDPTSTTSYLGTTVPGDGTHIRITDWDLGTTEPGSSGSPLFDQNKLVVGQLHGGYAACGNDSSDWYGRISRSWTGGGTSASRLSNWLDPGNTGVVTLAGRDQGPFMMTATPVSAAVCAPADATYTITITPNGGFADPVTLSASGNPAGTTTGFVPNPVTPPGASALTIGNTGAATVGSYTIQVTGTSGASSFSIPVGLDLFTAAPAAPVLTAPPNGSTTATVTPTFSWSAVAQASSYTIQIATDAGFTTIVHQATVGGTSYAGASLNTNTTYFWRVWAENACGVGAYSAVWSFSTAPGPGDCGAGTTPHVIVQLDFEGPNAGSGWTATTVAGSNSWTLSGVRPHSGVQAWHADDPSSISEVRLVSPPYALPNGENPVYLKFWNRQEFEDRTGGCYDGALLEVSTDDGATWMQATSAMLLTDPYDGPIATTFSNPLAGFQAWCGDPQEYLNSVVDMSSYAGQMVRLRFRVGTDSSVGRTGGGWDVDDMVIQSCQTPTAVELSGLETNASPLAVPLRLPVTALPAVAGLAMAAVYALHRRR